VAGSKLFDELAKLEGTTAPAYSVPDTEPRLSNQPESKAPSSTMCFGSYSGAGTAGI
jgi:hypothetical protein